MSDEEIKSLCLAMAKRGVKLSRKALFQQGVPPCGGRLQKIIYEVRAELKLRGAKRPPVRSTREVLDAIEVIDTEPELDEDSRDAIDARIRAAHAAKRAAFEKGHRDRKNAGSHYHARFSDPVESCQGQVSRVQKRSLDCALRRLSVGEGHYQVGAGYYHFRGGESE